MNKMTMKGFVRALVRGPQPERAKQEAAKARERVAQLEIEQANAQADLAIVQRWAAGDALTQEELEVVKRIAAESGINLPQ